MKKTLKFSMVLLVFLFVVCCFSACGCDHEWQEASCVEPKTCIKCGKIEGETIEHNYMDANCDNPQRCSYCDSTLGKSLGHDYINGYCTRCYEKDPNFVDLETFGFQNMYGMTEWMLVSGYKFSEGYVMGKRAAYGTNVYRFNSNYISVDFISTEDIISGNISKTDGSAKIYRVIDNDVADSSWYDDIIITERVADNEKGYLVLKVEIKGRERWFVPADLLELSKTVLDETDGETRVKMFFKDKAY